MAVTTAAPAIWLLLVTLGGASAATLGGAPLPLDPVLSAVAPEQCMWYVAYSGQGPADPASANQTEQLFAEPEVQRFAEELEAQIMRAVQRASRGGGEEAIAAEAVPVLIRAALTRPMAMYLEDAGPGPEGVMVEGAVVFNAGEKRAEVQTAIEQLLGLAEQQGLSISAESAAGMSWSRPALPPDAPAVRWTWKDDYLLIAVGEQTPQRLADRMGGSAPAWLDDLRQRQDEVTREISIGRVDVTAILNRIQPLIAQEEPDAWMAIDRLGLTSIREFSGRSGYDEVGCVSTAHLATDGQRSGLLAFLPHEPLSKRDLSLAPKDALIAVAKRLDPGDLWDDALDLVSQFEPRAEVEMEQALDQIETHLGVNVRRDIVDSLDDVWVAYLPSGNVMFSWSNAAVAVKVKDRATLDRAITKLCAAARAQMRPDDAAIVESSIGDYTLYSLQIREEGVPVSPSWCASDEWLVFGLSPQGVRAAIQRGDGESLADAPGVDDALAPGAAVLAYQDTPTLVRELYPLVQMGVQMLAGQLRNEGIEIDPSILPTADVLVRHMRPGVTTWSHESDGFHLISRGSLPGGGNLAAAAPMFVGMSVPAVISARQAARNAQDMNNLKQILLAFHNFHDANGRFPADIVDDAGKPLLSWRVAILPYLEQGGLQDRIHLDEPWDSPHNREVLQDMPRVFQSVSDEAPAGKTQFLGLNGPGTIFEGEGEISFRNITDGTSNTICVVMADADAAVEWAKPGDLPFDPEKPKRGLSGGTRGLLIGLCDGSVHTFPPDVSADLLRSMATRGGGEVINMYDEIYR